MVGCLSENTIQGLVTGSLPSDARARARQHIETCAQCRVLVIELARDSDQEAAAAVTAVTAPTAAAAAGLVPRMPVERFELVRPLGRGGMGVVYEAIDRVRGVRVALTTLQHVSADGLLRFKTEFRALQDVQHPSLVTFGELLEDRGQWWLTMELVEGTALLAHVRPGGRLDEHRLRAALPQLAAALHALHAHGLVHRDVKPHNVLVTAAGRGVLLDFGLVARRVRTRAVAQRSRAGRAGGLPRGRARSAARPRRGARRPRPARVAPAVDLRARTDPRRWRRACDRRARSGSRTARGRPCRARVRRA